MNRLFKQKPIVYLFIGWILAVVPHFFEKESLTGYFFMAVSVIFILYAFVTYFRKDF